MKELLNLSRNTLVKHLQEEKVKPSEEVIKKYSSRQACFVTLTKKGELRGCVGSLYARQELWKDVVENSINAGFRDTRFSPLRKGELPNIKIEISVLTVPQRLEFISGEDLLNKLRPMVDGVVLKQGMRQSTYLPQVWANFGSKEEFLPSLCQKGGMPLDCWKDTSTEVFVYQAFVFEE